MRSALPHGRLVQHAPQETHRRFRPEPRDAQIAFRTSKQRCRGGRASLVEMVFFAALGGGTVRDARGLSLLLTEGGRRGDEGARRCDTGACNPHPPYSPSGEGANCVPKPHSIQSLTLRQPLLRRYGREANSGCGVVRQNGRVIRRGQSGRQAIDEMRELGAVVGFRRPVMHRNRSARSPRAPARQI